MSTGTSPSIVAVAHPARSTHALGDSERSRDAGRLGDRDLRGAHDARRTSRAVAASIGRFGRRLAGLGIGGRDRGRHLPRDVEVHRSLRLQHPHELFEIEPERVRESRSEGNVTHAAHGADLARCSFSQSSHSGPK